MNSQKLKQHFELLIFYTKAKLEAESYRHFAGYLWWLLDPLIGVGIYYFLFKVIMNRGEEGFIGFLLLGLTLWKWISDSISKSSGAILSGIGLMKRIRLQAHIFPTVEIFYNSWKFALIFLVMTVGFAISNGVSLNHLFILPLLMTSLIFIVGVSFFLASIIPFLPDLHFIISYSMKLLFYASAVLYSESRVPDKYRFLIDYNPIANIIKSFREIMLRLDTPSIQSIFLPLFIGLTLGSIGLVIIRNKNREYAKLH